MTTLLNILIGCIAAGWTFISIMLAVTWADGVYTQMKEKRLDPFTAAITGMLTASAFVVTLIAWQIAFE